MFFCHSLDGLVALSSSKNAVGTFVGMLAKRRVNVLFPAVPTTLKCGGKLVKISSVEQSRTMLK
jgi:hypothetical protein